MQENLENNEQEKKIEDIAEQDWPYLKELESTRFALKNKKESGRKRQSLQTMKNSTEKEDEAIHAQNLEDEKLVEAFLNVKPSANTNTNEMVDLLPQQDIIAPIAVEVEKVELVKIENVAPIVQVKPEAPTIIEKEVVMKEEVVVVPSVVAAPVTQVEIKEQVTIETKETISINTKAEKDVELSKLIARGMAKTYISRTDTILNPLRFILSNSKQLGIALIQFIIPAIITWYLTTNIEMISNQLNKESMHVHVIYTIIFYFACLFLWITGQVLFGGIWNLIKQSMNNLAKAGKS
jgi:hypothetical protein